MGPLQPLHLPQPQAFAFSKFLATEKHLWVWNRCPIPTSSYYWEFVCAQILARSAPPGQDVFLLGFCLAFLCPEGLARVQL